MPCTEITRADTAARGARPEAGALLPPPNFPAGGFGDTRRRPLPFAAPTRAHLPAHEGAAKNPAAVSPAGRGASLPARLGKVVVAEIVPEPSRLAPDLAALVAIALFTAAIAVWLDALAGAPGI